MTLLEKAKAMNSSPSQQKILDPERLEVALAFLRGDITGEQCTQVLIGATKPGSGGSRAYQTCFPILKQALALGLIEVKERGDGK